MKLEGDVKGRIKEEKKNIFSQALSQPLLFYSSLFLDSKTFNLFILIYYILKPLKLLIAVSNKNSIKKKNGCMKFLVLVANNFPPVNLFWSINIRLFLLLIWQAFKFYNNNNALICIFFFFFLSTPFFFWFNRSCLYMFRKKREC